MIPSQAPHQQQQEQWTPALSAMILPEDDEANEIQNNASASPTREGQDGNDVDDENDYSLPSPTTPNHANHCNDGFFDLPCSPQELKRQKRKFVVFARILVEHLQRVNPALCERCRDVMRDCSRRTRRREPGYESCVLSVRARLQPIVPRHHWQEAGRYLKRFLLRRVTLPVISQDGS
eukprot:CAMPEP_0168741910 /NCGR_PEP_ID=MMETSP0724-20121128/12767_1 /TAXON_ID=265536 /ORGANISM="Amphiprora sp., Strain CCMP467" /LENGTH=177 /DNA_ID=CAMNT_0008789449 /DNA_START=73 /DNA_END=606 /DNA_ORIENTATION=+